MMALESEVIIMPLVNDITANQREFIVPASAPAGALTAQSIADRVNAVRDGVVRMSFSSRPGVCGDGMGSV